MTVCQLSRDVTNPKLFRSVSDMLCLAAASEASGIKECFSKYMYINNGKPDQCVVSRILHPTHDKGFHPISSSSNPADDTTPGTATEPHDRKLIMQHALLLDV